jgi:hypothetical protein
LLGGLGLPALAAFIKRPQAEAQIGADGKLNTTRNTVNPKYFHGLEMLNNDPRCGLPLNR